MTATPETPTDTERKTYSLIEFADMMGISYRHCAELAGEGRIPGVLRFGRRVVILREAVEQLVNEAAANGVSRTK